LSKKCELFSPVAIFTLSQAPHPAAVAGVNSQNTDKDMIKTWLRIIQTLICFQCGFTNLYSLGVFSTNYAVLFSSQKFKKIYIYPNALDCLVNFSENLASC
jgi:hypothetical protein